MSISSEHLQIHEVFIMEPTENNVEDQFKAFVRKEVDDFKQRILDQCNKSHLSCNKVDLRYDIALGNNAEKKSEVADKLKQLV